MKQGSQKYSNYHKSFDRAFSTRQDPDMIGLENAKLPALQTGELVTMPLDKSTRAENSNEQFVAKCGFINRHESLSDMHLKPVVIRGTEGLSFEKNHKVRLPPINVNLQVRDLLIKDERSNKTLGRNSKQIESSRTNKSITNCTNTTPNRSITGSKSQKPNRTKQNISSEKDTIFHFSKTAIAQKSTSDTRKPCGKMDFVEMAIPVKEYRVLPPIGKKIQQPGQKETQETGEQKGGKAVKQGTSESEKKANHDEDTLDLGEALEKLANDFEAIKGMNSTDNVKRESKKSREQVNVATTIPSKSQPKKDKCKEEGFTAIDNTLRNEPESNDEDTVAETVLRQESKRKHNYYSDGHIHDENERKSIRKVRKKGRRFAICEEMDVIYRDLAVIVKHNLLIQHLEEICIF